MRTDFFATYVSLFVRYHPTSLIIMKNEYTTEYRETEFFLLPVPLSWNHFIFIYVIGLLANEIAESLMKRQAVSKLYDFIMRNILQNNKILSEVALPFHFARYTYICNICIIFRSMQTDAPQTQIHIQTWRLSYEVSCVFFPYS
jgi:hypothetical protein